MKTDIDIKEATLKEHLALGAGVPSHFYGAYFRGTQADERQREEP